jgi:uncharacterized membrane protein (DUF485 family)
MSKTEEILHSERFDKLVKTRWTVCITLTVLLFILYYGYILIVAYGKPFLSEKVGVYTNYGIIFGVLTIVGAWVLTFIYVIWANNYYDKEVDAIKKEYLKLKG